MQLTDIWRDVAKSIKFYTKETASMIPERPGIYGWFLPLWLYKDDIKELVKIISKLYLYDAKSRGVPERKSESDFNWEKILITLTKSYKTDFSEDLQRNWDMFIDDPGSRHVSEENLMQASIFLPALYVGKTNNLLARYNQHVSGSSSMKNEFHLSGFNSPRLAAWT